MADLTATPSADRATIRLQQGDWIATIRAQDLPQWIEIYQRLHDREAPAGSPQGTPGPWGRFYVQPLAELRRVEAELRKSANA